MNTKSSKVGNLTDYSKQTLAHSSDLDRERNRIRELDVKYGCATIPYKGNDILVGLKGKKLFGQVAALEYAKRLYDLMVKLSFNSMKDEIAKGGI